MDKIAVLIPCYNESKTIEKVIKDFKEVLPDATIYVYDNNSTDGTDEIARRNGAIVRYEYQQGKGKKGKREKPSLRELEQQIRRDIEDGIDSTGKKMTLLTSVYGC